MLSTTELKYAPHGDDTHTTMQISAQNNAKNTPRHAVIKAVGQTRVNKAMSTNMCWVVYLLDASSLSKLVVLPQLAAWLMLAAGRARIFLIKNDEKYIININRQALGSFLVIFTLASISISFKVIIIFANMKSPYAVVSVVPCF